MTTTNKAGAKARAGADRSKSQAKSRAKGRAGSGQGPRSRRDRGRGRVNGAPGADPSAFRQRLGELIRERNVSPGWASVRAGLNEGLVQRWLRGDATPRSWRPLWDVMSALDQFRPLESGEISKMFALAGIPCPVPDESGFLGRATGAIDRVPDALGVTHPKAGKTERLAEAIAGAAVGGDAAAGTVQAHGATDTTSRAAGAVCDGESAYATVRIGARTPVVARWFETGADGRERWHVEDKRGEMVAVVFSREMASVVCGAINGLPEFLAVASEVIALFDGDDPAAELHVRRVRRLVEVSRRGLHVSLPVLKVGA